MNLSKEIVRLHSKSVHTSMIEIVNQRRNCEETANYQCTHNHNPPNADAYLRLRLLVILPNQPHIVKCNENFWQTYWFFSDKTDRMRFLFMQQRWRLIGRAAPTDIFLLATTSCSSPDFVTIGSLLKLSYIYNHLSYQF